MFSRGLRWAPCKLGQPLQNWSITQLCSSTSSLSKSPCWMPSEHATHGMCWLLEFERRVVEPEIHLTCHCRSLAWLDPYGSDSKPLSAASMKESSHDHDGVVERSCFVKVFHTNSSYRHTASRQLSYTRLPRCPKFLTRTQHILDYRSSLGRILFPCAS